MGVGKSDEFRLGKEWFPAPAATLPSWVILAGCPLRGGDVSFIFISIQHLEHRWFLTSVE